MVASISTRFRAGAERRGIAVACAPGIEPQAEVDGMMTILLARVHPIGDCPIDRGIVVDVDVVVVYGDVL